MRYSREAIARYLVKHAEDAPENLALPLPRKGLRLGVVIPALAERESIEEVLDSLQLGSSRIDQAEVVVVVNNPEDAPKEIVEENLKTIRDLKHKNRGTLPIWAVDRASSGRAFPSKIAGVGAARRTGMDLALRRLSAAGRPERSAIACLDADSPVAPGYLDRILSVFDVENPPLAGICDYRHPIPQDPDRAQAIVAYELWLRYLECGFCICGSPYAFQAIGSCTVVSPEGYAQADGMPRRQAGEDFYFLQKIAKVGGPERMVNIPGAVVFPSARVSHRVPFGTGRAMRRCQEEGPGAYLYVEPPQAFFDLRRFLEGVGEAFEDPNRPRRPASPLLEAFIDRQDGWEVLRKLRVNAPNASHFVRAVHTWFDSLQVVRYARSCKSKLGGVWIFEALEVVFRELRLGDAVAGLAFPGPPQPGLELQVEWLDRMRGLAGRLP